jgi:hypothetical protein
MDCRLRVGLLAGLLLAPSLAIAQDPAIPLGEARRITRQADGGVEQTKGDLLADLARKELRLNGQDGSGFTISFESLRALHVEKDGKHYLTIFYEDAVQGARFETVRLDQRALMPAADILQRQTGLAVDRTAGRHSFLGIPIRAAIGEEVSIVDRSGASLGGTLAGLSATSLALMSDTGQTRFFDAASLQRIRLVRSRGRAARKGFSAGFVTGAALCGVTAALVSHAFGGGVGADVFKAAGVCGAVHGGIGAAAGAAFPSYDYRQRRDVYAAPLPREAVTDRPLRAVRGVPADR